MAEDFAYQASFSIPSGEEYQKGDMVNIRGSNPEQFNAALDAFMRMDFAEKIAQAAASTLAQYRIARDLGGRTIEQDRNPQQGQSQPAQQPPAQQPDPYAGQYGNAPQNGAQQSDPWGQQQGNPPAWADPGAPAPQQQQAPPQQAPAQQGNGVPTQPPPHVGPPPHCSHGEKRFLAKPYKNGKPGYWMAWACPAQRGDNSQHELEFIRQS